MNHRMRVRAKREPTSEGEWEDVPYGSRREDYSRQSSVVSSPGGQKSSTRRRKAGTKTIFIAQRASSPRLASPGLRDDTPPLVGREQLQRAALSGASYTITYLLDIMSTAFRLLRRPLGVLLFIWILGLLFTKLAQTFRTVFSPFCIIPGISSSSLCYTPPDASRKPKWANYAQLVDIQSSTFEQLMAESVGGSGLSLEIKKAEMATSDLVTLVRLSDLTSKDLLANELLEFVEDAKKTGRGLQKLGAKIGGAVDSIMAVNDHAIHAIEAAKDKSPSALSMIVWPFSTGVDTQEVVLATFHEAMSVLAGQTERTILEAEANLVYLDRLEQHLHTLQEIISREDASISSAEEQLLSHLWTKLGGNKRELRGHERHLQLLKNLGAYRSRALAHVTAALHTLQALSADMEELRERVATPEIVGERIPVEVHMKSIRTGIERLKEGRMKAKEREAMIVRNILGIEGVDLD